MIIELFGPPAVGKTTLGRALRGHLERLGYEVELLTSSRPTERPGRSLPFGLVAVGRLFDAISRVSKLAGAITGVLLARRKAGPGARILEAIPPRRLPFGKLRYRRYLALLDADWQRALGHETITIVEQGYMSALSSLGHLGGEGAPARMRQLLPTVPQADILVLLDAPRAVLKARLRDRFARQGALERMLEVDLSGNLAQAEMVELLGCELRKRGHAPLSCRCLDEASLSTTIDVIAAVVERRTAMNRVAPPRVAAIASSEGFDRAGAPVGQN